MIELTKLNGTSISVNPDLIRTVTSTPDTLVTFTDGETLMVRESVKDVSAKFMRFKRSLAAGPEFQESPTWT
ncbi:MAG: flagellar FlbD family protein [Bdellovibrionota bacterium]